MASVTDNGDLNFGVVWHLVIFTVLVRSHCNLETCRHRLELISRANITVLQARSHWVNIEEWVLSVLDVCARSTVKRLVTLVTNSWQI